MPLRLFRDRNFSVANVAITTVGFAVTSTMFPIMIWAQSVRGLSPTYAALLMAPMAVISGGLAPVVGRLVARTHPRVLAGIGLLSYAVSLVWMRAVLRADMPLWELLLPAALLGVANGFMWAPLSTSATANPSASVGVTGV